MAFTDLHEIGEMFRDLSDRHEFLPGYSYVGRPISARALLAKLQDAQLEKIIATRTPWEPGPVSRYLNKPIEVSITPVRHAPKCGTYRDTSEARRLAARARGKAERKAKQGPIRRERPKPRCSYQDCYHRNHAHGLCRKHCQEARKHV